ncbi:MAG: haloacid dehalogenase-like hydrolase, partial [Actinobacteria bacterium]|nr:haloacid dehalogenase-like hydrolase [Actinomycetota bacterium]NIW32501.1 haloacid dehalogenase-like hydrolase [Actinomycetota bacterium]NIX24714.1 haloacid dehalogenase-like hydrolase [Actinomycetota bacterium]
GMLLGTIASLRDDGFPICAPGVELVLKPDATQGDESFKRKQWRTLRKLGDVLAVFDAAPALCDTARGFFPEAEIVLVDT